MLWIFLKLLYSFGEGDRRGLVDGDLNITLVDNKVCFYINPETDTNNQLFFDLTVRDISKATETNNPYPKMWTLMPKDKINLTAYPIPISRFKNIGKCITYGQSFADMNSTDAITLAFNNPYSVSLMSSSTVDEEDAIEFQVYFKLMKNLDTNQTRVQTLTWDEI